MMNGLVVTKLLDRQQSLSGNVSESQRVANRQVTHRAARDMAGDAVSESTPFGTAGSMRSGH